MSSFLLNLLKCLPSFLSQHYILSFLNKPTKSCMKFPLKKGIIQNTSWHHHRRFFLNSGHIKLSVQKIMFKLFSTKNYGILQFCLYVHVSIFQIVGLLESSQVIFFWFVYTWILYKCVSLVTYLGLILIKRLYLRMLLCDFTPLIKVCMRMLSSLLPRKCHLIFQNGVITSKGWKLKRELKTLKQWILTSAIMPQFSKWGFDSHRWWRHTFFLSTKL